ncbi:ATP-binding protein [Actinokineospora sp. PR83]|uniref:ATP-binding protein n=1 Tax=Actinokineospora sp. PR83 TaxID=2884908 RepID=UPI0027E15645|nr:ATP-binding protein [Actinokineospora sp. PR83]MCG8917277.1 ATP-binding protein [Actinokineospora sp. PR83]
MDEQAVRRVPVVHKREVTRGHATLSGRGPRWRVPAFDGRRAVAGAVNGVAPDSGRVRRLATRLPAAESSVAESRDFVSAALGSWAVPRAELGDIVLAVSELVTNAIEHGCGEVDVEVVLVTGVVRLRVGDHSAGLPVRQAPTLLSERSRGLVIVEALSTAWGYESIAGAVGTDAGKWVWADFAVSVPLPEAVAVAPDRRAATPVPLDNQ